MPSTMVHHPPPPPPTRTIRTCDISTTHHHPRWPTTHQAPTHPPPTTDGNDAKPSKTQAKPEQTKAIPSKLRACFGFAKLCQKGTLAKPKRATLQGSSAQPCKVATLQGSSVQPCKVANKQAQENHAGGGGHQVPKHLMASTTSTTHPPTHLPKCPQLDA